MSRTASKLTNSVRQAKGSQATEPGEQAPDLTATEAASEPEAPEQVPPRRETREADREERPLPRMPSRRVWPD